MSRTKILILVAAVALLAGAAALVWRDGHRGDADRLSLFGEVDIRQADLGFNVDGPVEAVLVEEGDPVRAGQLLARLEQTPYRIGLANAEASLRTAEEALRQYRDGFRKQEIEQSRANLAAAEAGFRNAELFDKRNQVLVGDNYVAASDSDAARAQRDIAAATLRQAHADLDLKLEGTREETIKQAEAQVAVLAAARDLAAYHLARTELKAPNDGIVLTRIKEPGAIVAGSMPVLTVSVIDPVWIRAYVDEPHLDWLAPGTKVVVTTDSLQGKRFTGRVGYISPTAEFTPKSVATPELRTSLVYRVRVIVDNPDASLRQGMPATVLVTRP